MSILKYILTDVNEKAKIFTNGGSQAVRLPKSCRFPEGVTEVVARREGRSVVLEEPGSDEWPQWFIDVLGSCPDFPLLDRDPVAGRNPFEESGEESE